METSNNQNQQAESFITKVIETIKEHSAKDISITKNQVTKPNDIVRECICVQQADSNIGCNYYLDELMEQHKKGKSIAEISFDILNHNQNDKTFRHNSILSKLLSNLSDYNMIKDYLFIRILNLKANTAYLADKVYYPYIKSESDTYELAICLSIGIPESDSSFGSIAISKSLRNNWNISDDELLKTATDNTKKTLGVKFQDLMEVLSDYIGENDFSRHMNPPQSMMYVLTNNNRLNGAATLLFTDKLKEISDKLNSDLFVIPSSIHELIIVPSDGISISPEQLTNMIYQVNNSEVPPSERLSNHLFSFSRSDGCVTIVNTTTKED